jgi:hypothetical protein
VGGCAQLIAQGGGEVGRLGIAEDVVRDLAMPRGNSEEVKIEAS